MKIVICASINITPKIKKVADELEKMGHEVEIPYMSQKILNNECSLEDFLKEKEKNGDKLFREQAEEDLIKRYYKSIQKTDAVLILNTERNGIENYVGGNTFLEMGFAHVLDKKIFLYNNIPEMIYKDEIEATKPIILNKNLNKINE